MRHRMVLAGALVLLAGCLNLGEGTRQRVRLYSLQPTVSTAEPQFDMAAPSVGVGPVYLPDYLQRTQVVTLVPPNEYRLAVFAKWAEPLEENILRVTAANLSRLLGNERILTFPWRSGLKPGYRIRMNIRRFEAVAGDAAHLAVHWSIEPPERGKESRFGLFEANSPLQGEGADAAVAAMSRTLGDFSRRMAEELVRITAAERQRPGE